MAVDLHLHTIYSDGTSSLNEILDETKHLSAISITDHDSIDAYTELSKYNSEVKIIPGIEISTYVPFEVHMLGYFLDVPPPSFNEELRRINLKRQKNIMLLTSKFYKNRYIDISPMQLFNKNRYVNLEDLYSLVKAKNEAITIYEFYYGKEYVNANIIGISPYEAIQLIKKYGGIASLAHPKRLIDMLKLENVTLSMFISQLIDSGLDAIECYHESFSEMDINDCLGIARSNNLMVTGGSDYHGTKRPWVIPGMVREDREIPDDILCQLNI